jgi:LytS/YehU family sensor histidine kinase
MQLENVQLKELNTKAELSMLKEQLNPHFMFNTLNSLSAVIRTSTKEASLELVDDISSVYRYVLDNEQISLIQLKEEIGFLNNYINLLKKRFNEALIIDIHIAEEFLIREIPPLTLQILIENVVKHNKILSSKPVYVDIKNYGDFLIVANTLNIKSSTESHGIGLANLNKRFKLLFNKEIEISKTESSFIVKLPI